MDKGAVAEATARGMIGRQINIIIGPIDLMPMFQAQYKKLQDKSLLPPKRKLSICCWPEDHEDVELVIASCIESDSKHGIWVIIEGNSTELIRESLRVIERFDASLLGVSFISSSKITLDLGISVEWLMVGT